jgi:hypothetical protein
MNLNNFQVPLIFGHFIFLSYISRCAIAFFLPSAVAPGEITAESPAECDWEELSCEVQL